MFQPSGKMEYKTSAAIDRCDYLSKKAARWAAIFRVMVMGLAVLAFLGGSSVFLVSVMMDDAMPSKRYVTMALGIVISGISLINSKLSLSKRAIRMKVLEKRCKRMKRELREQLATDNPITRANSYQNELDNYEVKLFGLVMSPTESDLGRSRAQSNAADIDIVLEPMEPAMSPPSNRGTLDVVPRSLNKSEETDDDNEFVL